MAEPWDVIVIGVGSMGASACYQLARRGASVLGLEQMATAPHDLGAHHGESRVFRESYFEHADYVPLLRRSYASWRALERASGQRLMYTVGGLFAGRPDEALVAGSLDAARRHGLPHEMLSRAEIAERYPQIDIPDDRVAIFEPGAGVLVPERIVSACVRLAEQHGATVCTGQRVIDVSERGALLSVTTPDQAHTARHVVFTTGAWTRDIGVPINVTRQVMGWVKPARPERLTSDVFPCFALADGPASVQYAFPLIDPPAAARANAASDPGSRLSTALDDLGVPPHGLLKAARHWHGPTTTPGTVNRQPEPQDADDFLPLIERHLPDAIGEIADIRVCLYANSPDGHFIIDHHPRFGPGMTTLACGFSGHGFKFVSVMGEIIADLALDGRTDQPIGFLSLSRFKQSRTAPA